MKTKLLSLFAMVLMAMGVQAQWTAPVAPEAPQLGVDYEADGETLYYLMNVGCGQFVTGANSWSTQISLTKDDNLGLEIVVEAMDESEEDTYPGAVKLRLNPNKKQYVNGDSGQRDFTGSYLFRDSEGSGFIDHNAQECWYWTLEKAESGFYYIHSAYNAETEEFMGGYTGAATQFAACAEAGAPVVFNAGADAANIEWAFIPVATFDKDAFAAAVTPYLTAMEVYNAKLNLYNALLEAQEAGVSTDAASAVYNNADATAEELNKATDQLKADIMAAEFGDKWDGASEEDPMDITEDVMVNPSFEEGMDGWTIGKGSATPATANWDAQGATTDGPMMGQEGDWGKNCEVFQKPFDISQHIDFLPAGVYKFTCQGFYRPDNVDGVMDDPLIPAELYAKFNDGTEQIAPLAHIEDYATVEKLYYNDSWPADGTRNGKYVPNSMSGANYHFHHYTDDNEELDYTSVLMIKVLEPIPGVSIGVRTTSKRTWVIFDNFTLTYYGKVDPNKLELQDLVKKNGQLYKIDDIHANKDVKDTYETVYDAAENATGDYETLLNNLKDATSALVASIEDYTELEAVYTETRELSDKLVAEYQNWPEVIETIGALADEMQEKLEDETADHAYLELVRDSAMNTIREYIASGDKVKAGDDLTILLENADFQKTVADNHVVPGWTTVGTETITDLSKDWGNIEVFNKSAEIQQTIKNMPLGAYDVTVQGFVRGDQNQVVLYAGDSKTSFKNISEEYMTAPSFGDLENESVQKGDWPYDSVGELEDGTTVYRPNSMQGASIYFATVNPETGEPYYTNKCRIVLTKPGDLTIGVKVSFPVDSWQWCLWDNFRIQYAGSDVALFADEIHNRQKAVSDAMEAEDAFVTAKANEVAQAAIQAGEDALSGDNIEAVFAAMTQLEEAEAYVKEGNELAQKLTERALLYQDYIMPEIASGDTEYTELVARCAAPLPDDFADNEALQAAYEQIEAGWAGYVLYDVKDQATVDNPVDVTAIIYNPNYLDPIMQDPSTNGWTIDKEGKIDVQKFMAAMSFEDVSEVEFYDNEHFDINQTLKGLEPGFYTVGVQGYYRAGWPSADDSLANVHNAILYSKTKVATFKQPLANIMSGAQDEISYYGLEGEVEITLNKDTEEETVVYVPNSMEAAATYLDEGLYPNELVFEVGDDGLATIGISKETHLEGDWTIFTYWTLNYMGKVAPDAINDIVTNDNKTKTQNWYDLTGRRVQKPVKGLYIMGGRKVLVK